MEALLVDSQLLVWYWQDIRYCSLNLSADFLLWFDVCVDVWFHSIHFEVEKQENQSYHWTLWIVNDDSMYRKRLKKRWTSSLFSCIQMSMRVYIIVFLLLNHILISYLWSARRKYLKMSGFIFLRLWLPQNNYSFFMNQERKTVIPRYGSFTCEDICICPKSVTFIFILGLPLLHMWCGPSLINKVSSSP